MLYNITVGVVFLDGYIDDAVFIIWERHYFMAFLKK